MKRITIISATLLLSGCLFESVPQLPKYTKGFGDYWAREGMTTEQWRADWVACGGKANGGELPAGYQPGDSSERIFALIRLARIRLANCMMSKGYSLQPGPFSLGNL